MDCVSATSTVTDGSELPFLLLRLADWVPQVQTVAQQAVSSRIRLEWTEAFVKNLGLIERLRMKQRVVDDASFERILRLLGSPGARRLLVGAVRNRSLPIRRAAFRILAADTEMLAAALKAEDAVLRQWSARTLVANGEASIVTEALASDPSPAVRREVLAIRAAASLDAARPHLRAALMDRSASVRETARFLLRQEGVDFAQFYRDALATGARPVASAVSGLAETGGAADAAILAPYLRHERARVRRAAVAGVIRLGGDRYLDEVTEQLADPATGVVSAAGRALRRYASHVGAPKLWALFEGSASSHARLQVVDLFTQLPKWESIVCLLGATSSSDAEAVTLAREAVRRWNAEFNRSQQAPSKEELSRVEAALADASLDEDVEAEVRFGLGAF